jgi:hypothetical protein
MSVSALSGSGIANLRLKLIEMMESLEQETDSPSDDHNEVTDDD